MNSMTGFASKELAARPFGKIFLEIRSTNHKFLEVVFHLPVGLLALEDKIKKEIEGKFKRGRIVCVMNIQASRSNKIFIDKPLLRHYVSALRAISRESRLNEDISLNTLVNLPGVLSLVEDRRRESKLWPHLKDLLDRTLADLSAMRRKEGEALCVYFKKGAKGLTEDLNSVKEKFKKMVKEKLKELATAEERCSFLKDSDITEEVERLSFHIKNFKDKLSKAGAIGKELDFIAQEMQREANTMGAKSVDVSISAKVVQIKSQVEKIREQLQNIE
ncbi:MAG: YicC family protein [Candidatus Omnitrophica bacterium]|nr:YicC family protein [Candidatus Omnitrophota bacterium]MDD5552477.1 YicC family protein [Candidatus Omnitrophota bacterium]